MKTFGLFDPTNPDHPIQTYEGVLTVLKGTTVTVLGEPEVEDERRVVITEIDPEPGRLLGKLRVNEKDLLVLRAARAGGGAWHVLVQLYVNGWRFGRFGRRREILNNLRASTNHK